MSAFLFLVTHGDQEDHHPSTGHTLLTPKLIKYNLLRSRHGHDTTSTRLLLKYFEDFKTTIESLMLLLSFADNEFITIVLTVQLIN